MTPIARFEDLTIWQEAQRYAVDIYNETQSFPKSEQFGITSQLRRSGSSISANIAEGFGRRSKADKLHFYIMAYGSLLETKNFLYLAEKLNYLPKNTQESLIAQSTELQKLLNAFMRPLK